MTEPGDARKIMQGCDLTADCPAVEHASDCWRGHWADADVVDEIARTSGLSHAQVTSIINHIHQQPHTTAQVDAATGAFYAEALERTPQDLRTRFITAFRERMTTALQAAKDTT